VTGTAPSSAAALTSDDSRGPETAREGNASAAPMILLTKREAEELLRRSTSIARVNTTAKDLQNPMSGNDRHTIVLLFKNRRDLLPM